VCVARARTPPWHGRWAAHAAAGTQRRRPRGGSGEPSPLVPGVRPGAVRAINSAHRGPKGRREGNTDSEAKGEGACGPEQGRRVRPGQARGRESAVLGPAGGRRPRAPVQHPKVSWRCGPRAAPATDPEAAGKKEVQGGGGGGAPRRRSACGLAAQLGWARPGPGTREARDPRGPGPERPGTREARDPTGPGPDRPVHRRPEGRKRAAAFEARAVLRITAGASLGRGARPRSGVPGAARRLRRPRTRWAEKRCEVRRAAAGAVLGVCSGVCSGVGAGAPGPWDG
jgi:hypothetical protein